MDLNELYEYVKWIELVQNYIWWLWASFWLS